VKHVWRGKGRIIHYFGRIENRGLSGSGNRKERRSKKKGLGKEKELEEDHEFCGKRSQFQAVDKRSEKYFNPYHKGSRLV